MIRCDALVAGAGPAGSLAALELSRAGFNVVIADGSNCARPRIGESLPGVGVRLLHSLALDVSGFGSVHHRIGGNLSCWLSEGLDATDFFCDPDGPGWRLSRSRFDEDLRTAATSTGVQHFPLNIDGAARKGSCWELRTKSGEAFECRWLVEATGRSSPIARRLGVGRIRDEGLVALYGFGAERAAERFDRTLIEAVPEGWWYAAVLPEGVPVLVLYIDPLEARSVRLAWLQALHRTSFVREFFQPPRSGENVFVTEAGGSRLERFHGTNWVACGDAAMAFDPLSSQGVYSAMYSGLTAARAIIASESGDASALPQYQSRLEQIRRVYRVRLISMYKLVTRWPHRPFWTVRHSSD